MHSTPENSNPNRAPQMITQIDPGRDSYLPTDDRRRAVRSLLTPATMGEAYSGGAWRTAPHLNVIDYEFRQLVETDKYDVLIVRMPVRHGKSEYLGRWAPAWYMLRNPSHRIIITTHTARLA